jgi:hypothetical protein
LLLLLSITILNTHTIIITRTLHYYLYTCTFDRDFAVGVALPHSSALFSICIKLKTTTTKSEYGEKKKDPARAKCEINNKMKKKAS